MHVTTTPAPRSSVRLDVELPPDRLDRALGEAVRRLSRRTRVAGFRPGKAPRVMLERVLGPTAVMDEAVEHLVDDAFRQAVVEQDLFPLADPQVEVVQAEEGKPLLFRATIQVRPEVKLGDYRNFNFRPEVAAVDDEKVDRVVDELRDAHATLEPVEGRGAAEGDYAVIGFVGTRDGTPFEGGTADRMPLLLGQERLIPGFEQHLIGVEPGAETEFDITFPEDYSDEALRGQVAHFVVTMKELRQKVQPPANDDFARSVGPFDDVAAMKADIRQRLERNALDHARHDFADKIIEYAAANATVELPDILVDQEVEVMHDELRSALARQGISEDAYRKVVEKTDEQLHDELRPQAEKRVKVLLVLSKVAEAEGVAIPDADVDAEIARARERYADQPRVLRSYESERGRNYIRSTLRRSRLVEKLIDEWLAAHPEAPAIPHLEDDVSPLAHAEAESAVGATEMDVMAAPPDGEVAAEAVETADPKTADAAAEAGADVPSGSAGA